jgi:predicted nucleotidyltransferase
MDAISEKVNGILEDYVRELQKHIHIDKAILYGSYAKGNYNEYSDVDIAIFSESFKDKRFVEITSFLFGLARKYKDICIEPVGFSVSDLQDNNPFVKEIINTGREIYFQ